MIVPDFASEYGIRLARWDGSWREFLAYVTGLFSADSRLARHFAPDND